MKHSQQLERVTILSVQFQGIESFRLWDEDDYEYQIFSILSIAHAWTSVILTGKRDSRRHSTTGFNENVVVAGTTELSNVEVLSFCYRERA